MRRRRPDQTGDAPVPPKSGRRSEAGDTLIEILIALTVIGVAATAILLAFATTISGSSDHRNFVTMDTMLRTAAAEVTSAIQQQSMTDFVNCSGASLVNNAVDRPPEQPGAGCSVHGQHHGSRVLGHQHEPAGVHEPRGADGRRVSIRRQFERARATATDDHGDTLQGWCEPDHHDGRPRPRRPDAAFGLRQCSRTADNGHATGLGATARKRDGRVRAVPATDGCARGRQRLCRNERRLGGPPGDRLLYSPDWFRAVCGNLEQLRCQPRPGRDELHGLQPQHAGDVHPRGNRPDGRPDVAAGRPLHHQRGRAREVGLPGGTG